MNNAKKKTQQFLVPHQIDKIMDLEGFFFHLSTVYSNLSRRVLHTGVLAENADF